MERLEFLKYLEQLHPFSASFRAGLTEILIEERYRKHEVIYSPSLVDIPRDRVPAFRLKRYRIFRGNECRYSEASSTTYLECEKHYTGGLPDLTFRHKEYHLQLV